MREGAEARQLRPEPPIEPSEDKRPDLRLVPPLSEPEDDETFRLREMKHTQEQDPAHFPVRDTNHPVPSIDALLDDLEREHTQAETTFARHTPATVESVPPLQQRINERDGIHASEQRLAALRVEMSEVKKRYEQAVQVFHDLTKKPPFFKRLLSFGRVDQDLVRRQAGAEREVNHWKLAYDQTAMEIKKTQRQINEIKLSQH